MYKKRYFGFLVFLFATVFLNFSVSAETYRPPVPTDLSIEAKTDSITLSWKAGSGETVAGYRVYVNGNRDHQNLLTQTSYTINDLKPNTTYEITVKASRSNGRLSPPVTKSVTTGTGTVKPSTVPSSTPSVKPSQAPVNIEAPIVKIETISGKQVLTWQMESKNNQIDHFAIYEDDKLIGTAGAKETMMVIPKSDKAHTYAVAAGDKDKNESTRSKAIDSAPEPSATTTPSANASEKPTPEPSKSEGESSNALLIGLLAVAGILLLTGIILFFAKKEKTT
jgi:hypothetical protein